MCMCYLCLLIYTHIHSVNSGESLVIKQLSRIIQRFKLVHCVTARGASCLQCFCSLIGECLSFEKFKKL